MRVYWKRPKKDFQIVRPDNEGDDYEVWVLTPTYVGTVQKAGTQRIMAEGIPFTNLAAASRHLLMGNGYKDLAEETRVSFRGAAEAVMMTGLDLVARNVWPQFCADRQIDPRSIEAMGKTYQLTNKEIIAFKIKR